MCKLKKSIYGLKQSPRCWNKRIHSYLVENGFNRSLSDYALYIKREGEEVIILGLYVDDIVILSKFESSMREVKKNLSSEFKMVDFGEISEILGVRVRRDNETLFLDQSKYAEEVLRRFGMDSFKEIGTPLNTGEKLSKSSMSEEEGVFPYREAIGSIMYLMLMTRPDLAASVQILSRFMEKPTRIHWEAIKRVLRYIQGTKEIGLKFQRTQKFELYGFCDSDWGGCLDTRRSTSGYVFLLGGAAVSWSSKRQATVAMSSAEAEYIAATHAAKESLWIRNLR